MSAFMQILRFPRLARPDFVEDPRLLCNRDSGDAGA